MYQRPTQVYHRLMQTGPWEYLITDLLIDFDEHADLVNDNLLLGAWPLSRARPVAGASSSFVADTLLKPPSPSSFCPRVTPRLCNGSNTTLQCINNICCPHAVYTWPPSFTRVGGPMHLSGKLKLQPWITGQCVAVNSAMSRYVPISYSEDIPLNGT